MYVCDVDKGVVKKFISRKVLTYKELDHIKDILVLSMLTDTNQIVWGFENNEAVNIIDTIESTHTADTLREVYQSKFYECGRDILTLLMY